MAKPICAVVGVGPGNGSAIARRFASEGYAVALLARSPTTSASLAAKLTGARAYECDVSNQTSIATAFAQIRGEMGEIDALVYNAGSGTWGTIEQVDPQAFEMAWRVNALGLFNVTREVIPAMKAKANGSIVVIGATAARRGMAGTAGFAPAKAAQRILAESMARHLWPAGIHVAVVIVDGIVDIRTTRERMPDKPDSFFIKPDDVAETVWWLTRQPRSAWSFEVEARPFGEKW